MSLFQRELSLLGKNINSAGMAVTRANITEISNFAEQSNSIALRRFLGRGSHSQEEIKASTQIREIWQI